MGSARPRLPRLIDAIAAMQKALSGLVSVFPIFLERILKLDPDTLEATTRWAVVDGLIGVFAVVAHGFFLG